ncbi:cobyric acid synthase [Halosquirtibacter xylanolyticus]|uniref:cobyric acid synthase n=1 Tax=Halosquirtibacter xylanolyticus TaxID=3374599 RepID=UPI003749CD4D|nr:cobyric acid synthase [Prolixibacteraceae bacterium]
MKKLKSIMFVGTGSDVGKSIVNTAVCRILLQDGYQPAPYKAQNMSLNSFATPDGFEIGRAQAVQAEACRVDCHTDMNPILLKPSGEKMSQVVLNGKPIGNRSAVQYFRDGNHQILEDAAHTAFDRLEKRYNPIVLEGAGSISELNLRHRDVTNMSMAVYADAATYLIADIDRGGVFGSVYGSIALLKPEERKQIKGIIINKFRGDIALFDEGRKILEEITEVPVIGVIPAYKEIYIEEEDSVSLACKAKFAEDGKINIAVILLDKMANFTDFSVLERDTRVNLYYTNNVLEVEKADIVILPGSKNTLADLQELQHNGVAKSIISAHRNGKTVIGICGGYQMMGRRITDPEGVEGSIPYLSGLGLLDIETIMTSEKVTKQTIFKYKDYETQCEGYEIHMGQSNFGDAASPLNQKEDGSEGVMRSDRCWGSYIHGILDNPVVIEDVLAPYVEEKNNMVEDYATFKDRQYDLLADHFRKHLDMEKIYQALTDKD